MSYTQTSTAYLALSKLFLLFLHTLCTHINQFIIIMQIYRLYLYTEYFSSTHSNHLTNTLFIHIFILVHINSIMLIASQHHHAYKLTKYSILITLSYIIHKQCNANLCNIFYLFFICVAIEFIIL